MSDSTASLIQGGAFTPSFVMQLLTFVVFLGLAVITWRYARHTKRMAHIMSKEFEMRFRPFLDVRVGRPHMQDDYSGFKIPLEMLLLGELPFRLTKVELDIRLGEDEILKLVSQRDIVLTREKPSLRQCVKGFSDERILNYYEARKNNSSKKPIEISYLSIYCKNMEEKEEQVRVVV